MPPFIVFILLTLCCHLSALPMFLYYLNPISARKLEPSGFFIEYYEVFARLKDLGNNTLLLIPQCSLKT